MDMAVGVIIGGAFTTIVTSLVNDILMPLIGIISGGVDLSGLAITVDGAVLQYGMFLQNIVNFLIVAFCMFAVIKSINSLSKLRKKEEEAAAEPPAESDEVKILKEIRDYLAEK
ncbi:MAG: large conductance mechanosensitive channel protein MscL [Clostridiales bacterium]|nr:large conductance mechanosensitive channel protein MscL [Candidatus Crickella caballi]